MSPSPTSNSQLPISAEIRLIRETILPRYEGGESRFLIAVLQEIQSRLGYLPRPALQEVSRHTGVSPARVFGVATFYHQFRLQPPGENQIKICLGTACHIKGGDALLDIWERELKIKEGETTADRAYSLERVACVGACAVAPVMVVNGKIMGKSNPISVKGVILNKSKIQDSKSKV